MSSASLRPPRWYYLVAVLLSVLMLLDPIHELFPRASGRWLHILAFSFSLSTLATPFCRKLALRWGLVDRPGGHKIHREPTPLLGGAAVFLGFTLPLSSRTASTVSSSSPSWFPRWFCSWWEWPMTPET